MLTQEIISTLQVLRFTDLVRLDYFRNRTQLYRKIRAGEFPAPIRLSKNAIGWRAMDIQRWFDGRAAAAERPSKGAEER